MPQDPLKRARRLYKHLHDSGVALEGVTLGAAFDELTPATKECLQGAAATLEADPPPEGGGGNNDGG